MTATEADLQAALDKIRAGLASLPAIPVAVINASTLVSDAQLAPVVAALQIQVTRDFAPLWGIHAHLTQIPTGGTPPADSWWLSLLDDADQAGALGYHDITATGLPLGKIFVRTTEQAGDQWTVTASHELLEMAADPEINLSVFVQNSNTAGRLYAYEVGDPCEADEFGYDINGVLVSDFITPAWFKTGSPGPFDFKSHIQAPLQLLTGGYIGIFDVSKGGGWQQLTAKLGNQKARAPIGSRRERRRIPRDEWTRSHAHA